MSNCKIHPERAAIGVCIDCSEFFCEECLDENGRCHACGRSARQVLEGFSKALVRWEESLHAPQPPEAYNQSSPAPRKKSVVARVLLFIFVALIGYSTFDFISHYNLNLGRMFLEQGNIPKALFHFEKAAVKHPSDADLRYILGNIYYQSGSLEESVAAFRLSIRIDSLHAGSMNNLAWIYTQLDINLDTALTLSKRSLEIEPDNPAYLDTIAEIYYLKKDYLRALTFIRKAIDQNPGNIEYYREKLKRIKKLAYSEGHFQEI